MAPSDSYWRMNTAPDLLVPRPVCDKVRLADAGHKVCRVCEGVEPDPEGEGDDGS